MVIPFLRRLVKRLKTFPPLAKLDWQLYLLKDFWATKIWTRTKITSTPFGFNLTTRIHPAYELMRTGKFEPDETRIFLKILGATDVFVDVGANLGYYCCLALQKNKAVIALEPQAQNLDCLYQNLISNGWHDNVEIYPIALSSKPGLLTLFGASGPSASLIQNWAGYSPRIKQTVPANTLDNVLDGRLSGKRLTIKIDVEGAEFQVLEGALATISRLPRPIWMIEVCFKEYHPDGINPDYRRIFDLFWDKGYQCHAADIDFTIIRPEDVGRWVATGVRGVRTFNYVFVDRAVQIHTAASST